MRTGINTVVTIVDDKIATISGDLIEPLEMYIGHHGETSKNQLESAKMMFHDYYETSTKHKECKRVFLSLSQDSEQLEIDIEKALLEQQRGGVSVERV